MIGLDTNVVVRFLTQDDPDQARRATQLLATLTREKPGFIPTLVWAESYWVLTRSYQIDTQAVLEHLAKLAGSTEVQAEDPVVLANAFTSARLGADFADALIAAAARRSGCETVATFDQRAAQQLGWQLI